MKQLVLLEYTFIMEAAGPYQHLFQFEQDLAKFFDAKNIEAEIVKPVEGQNGKRIMILKRKDEILAPPPPNPVGRPKSTKRVLNDLRVKIPKAPEKNFKTGVFVKSKGYIKR